MWPRFSKERRGKLCEFSNATQELIDDANTIEESTTSACLRQRVALKVRGLILNGQLRPGQRILQQRLARQFSVSQSVVREALVQTQFTGLIESVDNLGMFVAEIDSKKLLEAYQVRELIARRIGGAPMLSNRQRRRRSRASGHGRKDLLPGDR